MDQLTTTQSDDENPSCVSCGRLRIDLRGKSFEEAVTLNGQYVRFSNQEYRALELLMLKKDVVSKGFFLRHLYGEEKSPDGIADVLICKIRKKLANASDGKNYIRSIRGAGYRIIDPDHLCTDLQ